MRYLLLLLLFLGVSPSFAAEVKIGDKAVFQAEVADTCDELVKGLMFVKKLEDNRGMLFDFRPYQGRELSMWMKNTYIPLDMLFISCDFEIVDIYKNAEPLSLKHIKSQKPFCYVLEINGGQAANKNIIIGDKVLYSDTK